MAHTAPSISVVVLAFGEEPWLSDCLTSLLQADGDPEVVVVDNGCTNGQLPAFESERVQVLRPPGNLGFAGGCNAGAAAAAGDILVFVNSDAVVRSDALVELALALDDPGVGVASASIRLADRPGLLNSRGNPVHYLGITWSGGFEDPADEGNSVQDVASASGACMAVRRETWNRLGGFAREYFAYLEDTELSLRCQQMGLRVVYVPTAVVLHHYEFSRNAHKNYLLERNRLLMMLTLLEARSLALLSPAMVMLELSMLLVAARQGWLRAKIRGYGWIASHTSWISERRRRIQAARRLPDAALVPVFSSTIAPANVALPAGAGALNLLLRGWWSLVRERI